MSLRNGIAKTVLSLYQLISTLCDYCQDIQFKLKVSFILRDKIRMHATPNNEWFYAQGGRESPLNASPYPSITQPDSAPSNSADYTAPSSAILSSSCIAQDGDYRDVIALWFSAHSPTLALDSERPKQIFAEAPIAERKYLGKNVSCSEEDFWQKLLFLAKTSNFGFI